MRTVEGSAAEKKRNGTIDFWRFIFAAGIVMYHARPLFGRDLFVCGYIGVEFFFIVSGCLLMKKADERRMQAENAGGSLDIYGENLLCALSLLPFAARTSIPRSALLIASRKKTAVPAARNVRKNSDF